jgi:tetratricopeptide (TPR) repeat protein
MVWKALGIAQSAQGTDALPALEIAARLAPSDAEAHSNLGHALLARGRLAEAEASCRRAVAINASLADAHNNLGNALLGQRRYESAAASFEIALEIRPNFAKARNNLGTAQRALGRLHEAEAAYRRALALSPDFAEAHNNLGNVTRDLGQLDAAADCFRTALSLQPLFVEAHNNLGNVLLDLGQATEAMASYQRALEIRPDHAQAHNNLGNALRRLGEWGEAMKHYERALALRPAFAEAHCNAGDVHMKIGRVDAAAANYRDALAHRPDYAEAHAKLANALLQLWQHDAAVESCRRAIEIDPDLVLARTNLGHALLDVALHDEAEASYLEALRLDPDCIDALIGRGFVQRLKGRAAQAENAARRALEIDPDMPAALALLAELGADRGSFAESEALFRRIAALDPHVPTPWADMVGLRKMSGADTDWLASAERLVAQGLAPREEVRLRYAMGKYFEDVADFAQAFANYRMANELTKSHRPPYDRSAHTREVDRIIATFDEEGLRRLSAGGDLSARPVFIIGMPRSGTTLTEQILASHGSVAAGGELLFWPMAAGQCAAAWDGVDPGFIGTLAQDYRRLLAGLARDALHVVDKMPANFQWLGLIHAAFPNARIIHMRRHPVDTGLSIYFQNFSVAHTYANDLDDIAHYYHEYLRLMGHWRSILRPAAMLDVPYEGLIEDLEGWTRTLLEFIGLPWDPRCLEFDRPKGPVLTASRWQVRQKLGAGTLERRRHYDSHAAPLAGLADAARAYDRAFAEPDPSQIARPETDAVPAAFTVPLKRS